MMVSPCFQAVVVHLHLISGDSALHIVIALTFVMFEVGQWDGHPSFSVG